MNQDAAQAPDRAEDTILFHATSLVAMPSIQRNGLPGAAPWGDATLAAYHARLLEDAGHRPVILSLPLSDLLSFEPVPDWHALENPPLETVNRDVEALVLAWAKTDADWKASLDLLGSFCLAKNLPAALLRERCPLIDRWADESRKIKASKRGRGRKAYVKAKSKKKKLKAR